MYDGHRIFPEIMLFRWSSNSPVKADFVHLESDRLQQDYQFCAGGMIDHRSLDFVFDNFSQVLFNDRRPFTYYLLTESEVVTGKSQTKALIY